MKNLEINSKAVKKLGMAALITSSLLLGGCGSSENEKPKDSQTTVIETDSEEITEFEVTTMSVEETNELAIGYEINYNGQKKITVPDEDALEKKGLMYEITYRDFSAVNDEPLKEEGYSYDCITPSREGEASFTDENGIKQHRKSELVKLRVVEIVSVEEIDGKYYKNFINEAGEMYGGLLINQKNIDLLQDKIAMSFQKTRHVA